MVASGLWWRFVGGERKGEGGGGNVGGGLRREKGVLFFSGLGREDYFDIPY